jgi:hypothetical protein
MIRQIKLRLTQTPTLHLKSTIDDGLQQMTDACGIDRQAAILLFSVQKVHLDRRILVEPLSAIVILFPCAAKVPNSVVSKRGFHNRESILP